MKFTKRVLAVLLTVVMLFSLANAAMARGIAEGTCGAHVTWSLSTSGILTLEGYGDMRAYTPSINTDFRRYDAKIKSLVVKSRITSIGSYAFQNMPALISVKLGDDVVRVNNYAFDNCPLLTEVKLPTNLLYIGSNAFSNCTSLNSIVLPENVGSLNARAFEGCTALQTVEIQNTTCSISSTDVFPTGVTLIGYKGSTTQTFAEKNGLAFKEINGTSTNQPTNPTNPTQPTTPTTDGAKCPLCGQTHEGFPGSLIGFIHNFLYNVLILFGMRQSA